MEVDLTPQERARTADDLAPKGTRPFVVRGAAQKANYDPMNFDLKEWFNRLTLEDPSDEKKAEGFDVRLGPRSRKSGLSAIQYEKVCAKVKFHERQHAVEWLRGDAAIIDTRDRKDQKQVEVTSGTHWGLFTCNLGVRSIPENRNELSAHDVFKLSIDADDQTLFIGTTGANIPCHQHSDGFDVHLVIQGTERWVLFPPNGSHDTKPPLDLMRTSRFPFELSTVYTRHNIIGGHIPDEALPYEVELRAGDLLYIPAKWWHCFVVPPSKTIKYSISISARCNRKPEQGLAHPRPEENKEPTLWSIMDPLQKAFSAPLEHAFVAVNHDPPQMNSVEAADEDIFHDEPESPTQGEALELFLADVGIKESLTIYNVPDLNQILRQATPTTPEHNGAHIQLLTTQYTWKKPYFTSHFTMQLHNVFDAFAQPSTVDHVKHLMHPNHPAE